MKLVEKRIVAGGAQIQETTDRLADEIIARHKDLSNTALVGIHTAGVPLAQAIAQKIQTRTGTEIPLGMIDITLYRDDVFTGLPQPIVGATDFPFQVTRRKLVLVDDVLFTGRTIRAALDAIIDFGRPSRIELLVLADRGHRELPIAADYIGYSVATSHDESVKLELDAQQPSHDRLVVYERALESSME